MTACILRLGLHDSREAAAKQVLALDARIALTWERTVIGGREGPHDFAARLGDIRAGRIYRTSGSGGIGYVWIWNVYATLAGKRRGGSSKGRCDDRIAAASEVERAFTEWLATPD